MGSCGFYGSRKAIFMRLQLGDSDESHLMKRKKCRFDSSQFQRLGGCEGSPGASLMEECCQGLGSRSTLVSEGRPRAAGDAAGSLALSVREHMWSCVHKKGEEEQRGCFSVCTWIYLQATISDSTAAIIKCCFSFSYYGLIWHPQQIILTPRRK